MMIPERLWYMGDINALHLDPWGQLWQPQHQRCYTSPAQAWRFAQGNDVTLHRVLSEGWTKYDEKTGMVRAERLSSIASWPCEFIQEVTCLFVNSARAQAIDIDGHVLSKNGIPWDFESAAQLLEADSFLDARTCYRAMRDAAGAIEPRASILIDAAIAMVVISA